MDAWTAEGGSLAGRAERPRDAGRAQPRAAHQKDSLVPLSAAGERSERPRAARDRARREPERSAPRGAGWVEGAGRAEGAGSEKGAASAAASAPPPPPDRRGCARLRTQLPRNDAPRSGSLGPRPALKGRAPPLGACAELSASPGGREAGWGRGMGAGRLSQ